MRQALGLGVLAAANIVLTFLFQWYVMTQLGAGVASDALFAGMALPQLVLAVISGSLVHVLVPLLAGEDEAKLRHDAWGFLFLIGGLFSLLALAFFLTAPWWIPLAVPGFGKTGQALTVELTRIQLIGMVFTAVNGVQLAAYHARQRFIWAEITPLLTNLLALLGLMWVLPNSGVTGVAWISALRMALQTLLLFPGMGRPVWPNFQSPAIETAWQRVKPLLLGTSYYKSDTLIDRFLLSSASGGSLSLYYLAQQLYAAATQMVNKSIVGPLIPRLSGLQKSADTINFRRLYHQKLLQVSLLCLMALITLGVAGESLLDLLIGHGKIRTNDVNTLWWIMFWLSGVFIGGNGGQICASTFYALGDTKTPTKMSVFSYSIYIPCKIIVYYISGVMGLAIVTSIYYLANFFTQILILQKKLNHESAKARCP